MSARSRLAAVDQLSNALEGERDRVLAALLAAEPLQDITALPRSPGIYTFWAASAAALRALGLESMGGQRALLDGPLYLGKAEDSLRKRVADTHLRTGKTGHSTGRRAVAALLDLESCPRPSRIAHPTRKQLMQMTANFGLVPADEERLTSWMMQKLLVRVVVSDWDPLCQLERALGPMMRPPLDQEKPPLWSPNPWRPPIEAARERLRMQARGKVGLA